MEDLLFYSLLGFCCCCFPDDEEIFNDLCRPARFLFCHRKVIRNLKVNLMKLESEARKVQQYVADAKSAGKEAPDGAVGWLQNVSEVTSRAREVINEEEEKVRKKWCPNLKLRHRVSKKAAKETESVVNLLREGEVYRIAGGSKVLVERTSLREAGK